MIVPRAEVADTADVAAHYDDLDELYRSLWGTSLHHGYWITGKESPEVAVANLTRLVANRSGMRPGDRVCDLGCGYGAAAILWQRDFGVQVTGITISEKQFLLGKSAAAGNANIQLILGDAARNGLPAESFDVATVIESSEHMPDKLKFFIEARRLLRRGGRCVVAAWLTCEQPTGRQTKFLLEPICREGRLPSMASASEYRGMLEQAGFHDVECANLTRCVKRTWSICARRVVGRFLTDRSFRSVLFDPAFSNRIFARTVFRIWLAYQIGAMQFGVFSAQK
ncbi:MAG TPA: class I SAM-dependent methyltransferase [Candidatus Binatia bacterium]|nr:class I SAM-dependent methyltransferase [Candidatus Binatia bacterium]